MNCPWGHEAFSAYLGADQQSWRAYDACALLEDNAPALPIKIDQGDADNFLAEQLQPEAFIDLCQRHNVPLTYNWRAGYDHSYFFIASFIHDHIEFHANNLKN